MADRERLRAARAALETAERELQAAGGELATGLASSITEAILEVEAIEAIEHCSMDVRAGNVSASNTLVPWGAVA